MHETRLKKAVQHDMPYLEIVEEPQEKIRFRYRTEMKEKHGCLLGCAATKENKTYPTVKLHNYAHEAVIRVTLCDANGRLHPHHIQEQPIVDDSERPYEVVVGPDDDHEASLNDLCIVQIPKKSCPKTKLLQKMKERKKEQIYWETGDVRDLTAEEEKSIRNEVKGTVKELDLKKVYLLFEAFCDQGNGRYQSICPPKRSTSIVNSHDVKKNNLKIVYLSTCSAVCTGGQEMCILVDKVQKNDITVQFFEEVNGNEVWEREAEFSALGVHHQHTIVFIVPPYHSSNIMEPREVFVRLSRKSDGECSEPRKFKYTPQEMSLKRGRKASNTDGIPISPSKMPHVVLIQSADTIATDDELTAQESDDMDNNISRFDLNLTPREESTKVSQAVALLQIGEALQEWAASEDIEVLLKRLHHLLSLQTVDGENALHTAVLNNKIDALQSMLKVLVAVEDFATLDTTDLQNQTPLLLAVKAQSPVLVKHLLNAGANANIPDTSGNTPFHVAARNGQAEIVSSLIQSKRSKEAMNAKNYEGMTPLHIAVSCLSTSVVRILCEAKVAIDNAENFNGRTALHFAAELGAVDIAACLIQHSADVNRTSYNGNTALHIAVSCSNKDMCQLLMDAGANPYQERNADDEQELDENKKLGKTPFYVDSNEKIEAILRRDIPNTEDDFEVNLSSRELTSQHDLDCFNLLDIGASSLFTTVFNTASVDQLVLCPNSFRKHEVDLQDLQDFIDAL